MVPARRSGCPRGSAARASLVVWILDAVQSCCCDRSLRAALGAGNGEEACTLSASKKGKPYREQDLPQCTSFMNTWVFPTLGDADRAALRELKVSGATLAADGRSATVTAVDVSAGSRLFSGTTKLIKVGAEWFVEL